MYQPTFGVWVVVIRDDHGNEVERSPAGLYQAALLAARHLRDQGLTATVEVA